MQRILLVRHGRSAHIHDGRWMQANEVAGFEHAYNAAGIHADDTPPTALIELAASAGLLVASDLPRAVASARRLAPSRDPIIVPLLREFEISPPRWIPFRLPITVWDVLNHAQWTYRMLRRADHETVRRADEAADWLNDRAQDFATIVAVTHGGFRRIVAQRLVARGWRRDALFRSYANWSAWSLSR